MIDTTCEFLHLYHVTDDGEHEFCEKCYNKFIDDFHQASELAVDKAKNGEKLNFVRIS